MSQTVTMLPFPRGKTFLDGRTATGNEDPPVGQEYIVKDDYFSTGRMVTLRLVKNNSGVTVYGHTQVLTNVLVTEINGVSDHDYDEETDCAPITDYLPTGGCPTGDWMYVVVEGPALWKTQIAETNDNIVTAGAFVRGTTIDDATTAGATQGRVQAVEITSSVTVAQQEIKSIRGRAISAAATSGVTDTSILVDIWRKV